MLDRDRISKCGNLSVKISYSHKICKFSGFGPKVGLVEGGGGEGWSLHECVEMTLTRAKIIVTGNTF